MCDPRMEMKQVSETISDGRKVILCIDDDPNILATLKRTLRKLPYDVVTAVSPWQGVKLAVVMKPDLVLLDITMPGLNGKQVFEGLREMLSDLPVVFITGEQEPEMAMDAYEMGAAHYIRKPFDNEHLRDVVEFLIGDVSDESREELMARL